MSNVKSILSPGLINLLLVECLFLLLVVYIGLGLWVGMPVTVSTGLVKFAAGLLFLLVWSRHTGG